MPSGDQAARELAHHEDLYAGHAQEYFAKNAVRQFRRHLVERVVQRLGLGPASHVLSLGCGIGDTEILLAKRVGHVTGVDLSPRGIAQAQSDAAAAGVANTTFEVMKSDTANFGAGRFDAVLGIFFLHHLTAGELAAFPQRLREWLRPGGCFYGVDPNRRRLSGILGRIFVPRLMARYQTPDERQLLAGEVAAVFRLGGFDVKTALYDFVSTPLAGLCPAWRAGYRAARIVDELLIRTPLLRAVGSNFEVVARAPR